MPVYYRGAAPGTYWNANDARLSGFIPRSPGVSQSASRIIQHVSNGLTQSPYVSLTRSYPVALHYALESGTSQPTIHAPGYVYLLEIDDTSGAQLIDPVQVIAAGAAGPFSDPGYQHDGHPTVILGVASPLMAFFLRIPIQLPRGTSTPVTRLPSVSPYIWGLIASLRDAEILAIG